MLTCTALISLENILLVVLRGVGVMRFEVLEFISDVVKEAAKDRKTVRVSTVYSIDEKLC